MGIFYAVKQKRDRSKPFYHYGVPPFTGANIILATEAADPAENLPDGIATCVAVGITREEKHLADLLFRICLARTNAL
ncbi:MAG: hypothetical protein E7453_09140 [Ruminococcaceae bacterium]|nr:hypothetical protein [Oscillospiraceae bacterium]